MSMPSSRVGVAERTFGSQGFGDRSANRSCSRSRSSRLMSAVCSAATMRRMADSRYSHQHPRAQVVTREQGTADDRAAEELVDALPDLADDRVGLEGLIEDARHVVQQLLAALFTSDRGRRAGADQSLAGHSEPRAKPPDEACQIGALGAVEGVQLVHHQIAQGVGGVVAPEPVVDRPNQQEIQHLVVCEKDVRRALAQGAAVRDDVVRSHGGVGCALAFADIEARAHPAAQRRGAVDGLRDPPGLVHRQGIHRVDEDCLDPLLPPAGRRRLLPAVVEDRVQEALRLARAGAGGDDGRATRARGKPREGGALVAIRREPERHLRERLAGLAQVVVDAFFDVPVDLFARDDRFGAHARCRWTRSRRLSKYALSAGDVAADAAPPSNKPRRR